MRTFLRRLAAPLASRKVRVAVATVVSSWLVQWVPSADESSVYLVVSVVAVGVGVILGIAIEDNGSKSNPG